MPSPARQRILDAALSLIRERGIGRVTTKEIALAADAAEGSLFKNFGDKMGLLTELLSYELPENRAWRAVPAEAPPGQGDLVTALAMYMERAIDFYAAALPIVAGSFADRELQRRHQELNRDRRSGPQLALEGSAGYLRGWQESGQLDGAADPYAMAAALCGGALMCAFIEQAAGAEQVRGGRGGLIQSLIGCVAGPYITKGRPLLTRVPRRPTLGAPGFWPTGWPSRKRPFPGRLPPAAAAQVRPSRKPVPEPRVAAEVPGRPAGRSAA